MTKTEKFILFEWIIKQNEGNEHLHETYVELLGDIRQLQSFKRYVKNLKKVERVEL